MLIADLSIGRFCMCVLKNLWEKIIRSPLLEKQSCARKLATLGVTTAFSVIVNTLFEFKLMDTQYSLTIAVSAFIGILLGGGFGFIVSFLGDLIGFLINASGFAYMPWIGLSMGGVSLFSGVLIGGINPENKWGRVVMTALVCLLSFAVCSVVINTTAFYFLYADGVDYWTYFVARFIVKGQLWNCIFNYVLIFFELPLADKLIKILKKH